MEDIMKRNNYSITLIGCSFCFFLLAFLSLQSRVYPASSNYFDTVQKTYIGYYHRPADPEGVIYWGGRLNASGGNLTDIIEAFANSPESQALYGTINGSSISNVVNSIYEALFNRGAETAGLNYYVSGFNSGRFTAATIMLDVLYGAQNQDLQSLNDKLAAANRFTRTIDPELDGFNFQVTYAGNADAIKGRTFLTSVTDNPATIPTQDETTAYMKNSIADLGDPIFNPGVSLSDLSGMWETNCVGSPTAWWQRGSMTVGSNGSFSVMFSGSDGSTAPLSGTMNITPDGIITATGEGIPPSFRCTMDSGKSVVACTFTVYDGTDADMTIFTKKAPSYSLGDLTGLWEMNEMKSSYSWWERGSMTVGSNGSFSVSSQEIDGGTIAYSGTMSITNDGIITAAGVEVPPSFRCAMDSDKSVAVCTFTSEAGHSCMMFLTRKAATYSQSDLSGMWEMNLLTSSDAWWERGFMTISPGGSFSVMSYGSDESTTAVSGTFSISLGGIITAAGVEIPPSFRCAMDSDKSVAACTFTDSDGVANMMILTKKVR
jgi:hypothetical protein